MKKATRLANFVFYGLLFLLSLCLQLSCTMQNNTVTCFCRRVCFRNSRLFSMFPLPRLLLLCSASSFPSPIFSMFVCVVFSVAPLVIYLHTTYNHQLD